MRRSAAFWLVWAASSSAAAQDLSQRVSLDCERAPIEQVVDRFRAVSGSEIRIDASVRERFSPDELRVTFKGRDLTVRAAMRAVLASKRLTAVRRGDSVTIVPRSALFATEIHDVRDLLVEIRDFEPPDLGFPRVASGPPPAFAFEKPLATTVSDSWIVELVRTHTGGRSWDEPEPAINLVDGLLIVTQTRAAQREIKSLLQRLRRRP